MTQLILYHAPADEEPARRLVALLSELGHAVQHTSEISDAPPTGTALALLSPAALAAPAMQRQMQQGAVAVPVAETDSFPTGADLAALLQRLGGGTQGGGKYIILGNAQGNAIGDNARTVNIAGFSPAQAEALLAALEGQAAQQRLDVQELAELMRRVEGKVDDVSAQLTAMEATLLARFDQQAQAILSPLLARLEEGQAYTIAQILDGLEQSDAVTGAAADELAQYLAEMEGRLEKIAQQPSLLSDAQLAAASAQTSQAIKAPQLDMRHRLKVTVPLIPFLLFYENETDIGSGLELEKVWQALIRWSQRADKQKQ